MSEPPGSPLPSRVVAIGASAGGLAPINRIVESLPGDLDAAVLVVLHLAPTAPSALPNILARHSKLPVDAPKDGEPLLTGHVYVARPDYHLEVEDSVVRVLRGPWENGHRPAIDVLFRSVAQWWGSRAIAIVLSGALDDGTAGLTAVRRSGGLALVQDPHEAVVPGMPLAAIEAGAADEQLSTAGIAARVVELCTRPVEPAVPEGKSNGPSRTPGLNSSAYAMQHVGEEQVPPNARPAGFVCPDCGGAMFEVGETPLTLRCRVGHAWSAEALHGANSRQFEEALWAALRILEEDRALQHRLADRARAHERPLSLSRIERRIGERTRLIELLRSVIAERAVDDVDRLDDGGDGAAVAETHG